MQSACSGSGSIVTGAPVTIEPDPLHADCMDHGSRVDRDDGYEAAVLLGFFDTGDALRALIDALPGDIDVSKMQAPL